MICCFEEPHTQNGNSWSDTKLWTDVQEVSWSPAPKYASYGHCGVLRWSFRRQWWWRPATDSIEIHVLFTWLLEGLYPKAPWLLTYQRFYPLSPHCCWHHVFYGFETSRKQLRLIGLPFQECFSSSSNWTHCPICFQQWRREYSCCRSKVQTTQQSFRPIFHLSFASNSNMESRSWRSGTTSSQCHSVPFCLFYHTVGRWTSHGHGLIISSTSWLLCITIVTKISIGILNVALIYFIWEIKLHTCCWYDWNRFPQYSRSRIAVWNSPENFRHMRSSCERRESTMVVVESCRIWHDPGTFFLPSWRECFALFLPLTVIFFFYFWFLKSPF